MPIEMTNRDQALTVMDEPNGAASVPRDDRMALFPEHDTAVFRERWHDLQSHFVDEPRNAVEDANELVGKVVSRLTERRMTWKVNVDRWVSTTSDAVSVTRSRRPVSAWPTT